MNDNTATESLVVVWTSSDPEVADNVAFMYTHNALKRKWWRRVRLLVWGPSAKLASENAHIQSRLQEMMDDGVEVIACRACAENYGVVEKLETVGMTVEYVGEMFTTLLRDGWKQLTF